LISRGADFLHVRFLCSRLIALPSLACRPSVIEIKMKDLNCAAVILPRLNEFRHNGRATIIIIIDIHLIIREQRLANGFRTQTIPFVLEILLHDHRE